MIEALPKELRKELVLYQNSDIKDKFLKDFDNRILAAIGDEWLYNWCLSVYTYDPPYQIVNKTLLDFENDTLGMSNLKDNSLLYVYGFKNRESVEDSWELICRYQTSIGVKYIYYTASEDCGYYRVGDYDGGGHLYMCDKYEPLIHHCVTQRICNELELDKFL